MDNLLEDLTESTLAFSENYLYRIGRESQRHMHLKSSSGASSVLTGPRLFLPILKSRGNFRVFDRFRFHYIHREQQSEMRYKYDTVPRMGLPSLSTLWFTLA